MKKVQRMLNFHTYKRLFCANCDVIALFIVSSSTPPITTFLIVLFRQVLPTISNKVENVFSRYLGLSSVLTNR